MGIEVLARRTLRDIVAQLGSLTDEDFICVEGRPNWTADAKAYVVRVPKFTDLSTMEPLTEYFLEAFIAREVLQNWSVLRGTTITSIDEQCEVLIYYALHDGYPPLI